MVRRLMNVAVGLWLCLQITTMAPFTPRFAALKRSLITPENESKLTESWKSLLNALETRTAEIEKAGPAVRVWRFLV